MSKPVQSLGETRLTEEERRAILRCISDITERRECTAIAAYGSRVAGYAKKDSDYDILIGSKEFRPKAKYKYLQGDVNVSVLLVDDEALLRDAERASLGEFVVGRLLNIYLPLQGGDFLRRTEVSYKERVVTELVAEIVAAYHDFSSELFIPPEYFLFEKLRKRATTYPPALYSYVKTYTGPKREENLCFTLNGFSEALERLAQKGLMTFENGFARIPTAYAKARQMARLSEFVTHTRRGLTQYAVHGYAGRVGLKVVGREALSKLRRRREVKEVPRELVSPKSLWRIEEGLLVVDGDDWLRQTLESLGLSDGVKVRQDQLGEMYNVSRMYILKDGEKEIALAVKKFRDIKSFKWALLNIWTATTKRFNMSPIARLQREYHALRALRRMGLNTPRVVSLVLSSRILVTEYISGPSLGQITSKILQGETDGLNAVTMYGENLATVHRAGYTLGDSKPSNAILSGGKIFLTDLEQASPDGDEAWDVAEFIYFSSKLTYNTDGARAIARAFLKGYLKHADPAAVKAALNLKYLATFQPFLLPTVCKAVRREMKRAVEEGDADSL